MARPIGEMHEKFDSAMTGQTVACRRGCAHCCHDYVPVAAEEAFRIADALRRRPAASREAVQRRLAATDAKTRGLSPEQRRGTGLACAFLEGNACGIYEERPLACRAMASLDERACRRVYAGLGGSIPIPPGRVETADKLRAEWRLPRHHYELAAAVLLALVAKSRSEDALAGARAARPGAPAAPTLRTP